jgi:hypothetical protein
MGIEFEGRALTPLSRATIAAVFSAVALDQTWHVVRRDPHELALRPAEEEGEETVVVEIDGATIFVLFQVATEAQRSAFLALLQATLANQGVQCVFKEL